MKLIQSLGHLATSFVWTTLEESYAKYLEVSVLYIFVHRTEHSLNIVWHRFQRLPMEVSVYQRNALLSESQSPGIKGEHLCTPGCLFLETHQDLANLVNW